MKNIKIMLIAVLVILNPLVICAENINSTAESQILMDAHSGRVFYMKNPHKKMPMASTTKIMTAIIALENGDLNDKVVVKKEWTDVEGSSIYLKEGESISLEDMLYGLMLRSGNDVAVAISSYIGNSMEEFLSLMNEKAKSIGALNTNFMNPHGLHDDNHYTTAYDLALISKEAFKYPVFAEIVKSKSYISNREINNYYYNKNKTLWEYEGGDGVKTGYTMRAGRCLVSSANRNDMRLIAVSLNARNWFNDNYTLLDYGFDNYKSYLIYDLGQFIKKVKVENGEKEYLNLITNESFSYPLAVGEKEKITVRIEVPDSVKAPVEKGDKVGYIYCYLDNKLINKTSLVSKSDIKKPTILKRIMGKIKFN